jgi:hypothetical protein
LGQSRHDVKEGLGFGAGHGIELIGKNAFSGLTGTLLDEGLFKSFHGKMSRFCLAEVLV